MWFIAKPRRDEAVLALEAAKVSDAQHSGVSYLLYRSEDYPVIESVVGVQVFDQHRSTATGTQMKRDQVEIVLSAKGDVELEGKTFLVTLGKQSVEVKQVTVCDIEPVITIKERTHDADHT